MQKLGILAQLDFLDEGNKTAIHYLKIQMMPKDNSYLHEIYRCD
jgi:hypothetical protein